MLNRCSLFFGLFFISCFGPSELLNTKKYNSNNQNFGLLQVSNQILAPQSFKSLQLYKNGNIELPPIIELNKNEKLVLEFDELSSISGEFRLVFQHYDQDWKPSNIPDNWFLEGFNEIIISGGQINTLNKPNFIHYKAEFPTQNLKFITSGNFMVHIHDFVSNQKLFSLPFFITENKGSLDSTIETVFNSGRNGEAIDQYFGEYSYPKFVEFPQFELNYEIVQNRFWGSSIRSESFSTTNNGVIEFHTPRNKPFSASFDFINLDLTEFAVNNYEIEDWQPEFVPPRVILRPDFVNFLASPTERNFSSSGIPYDDRNSQYVEVTFQLDASPTSIKKADIYVSGDFNQWNISKINRMRFNTELGMYSSSILIKQGSYKYKYFYSDSKNFLPVNDSITKRFQEYISFIYYTDPVKTIREF